MTDPVIKEVDLERIEHALESMQNSVIGLQRMIIGVKKAVLDSHREVIELNRRISQARQKGEYYIPQGLVSDDASSGDEATGEL